MSVKKVEYEVLDICPAPVHNTLRAGIGRDRHERGRPKCICDRARELVAAEKKRRRGRVNRTAKGTPGRPKGSLNAELAGMPAAKVARPDFGRGNCTTPEGQKAMDTYLDNANVPTARNSARNVCMSPECSIREQCLVWIIDLESRIGSQAGIYAGYTQTQRETAASQRRANMRVGLT